MDEQKKDKEKKRDSLLGQSGPVRLGAGQLGEKHLGASDGHPGYTQGVPFEEDKYVTEVIGGDYHVPTDEPSFVRSGAEVPRMGETEIHTPPVEQPSIRTMKPPAMMQGKYRPRIDSSAKVDPAADIRGNVIIGAKVHVAAGTIISAHEDEPIYLCSGCAIFEGAVLTILPVRIGGQKTSARLVKVEGSEYPLYIGENSVIAPRAQLTGPCYVGHGAYIGAGTHIFWAKIGNGSIVEPGAFVMNVEIPPGHFVPSGLRVTSKDNVKNIPKITDRYRFRALAEEMLEEIRSRT